LRPIERWLPRLVGAGLLALLALSLWQWRHGTPLNTSLMALLPNTANDLRVQQATERMAEPLNREVLLLIGHTDAEVAIAQVRAIAKRWQTPVLFEHVQWQVADHVDDLRQFIQHNRLALLSITDQTLLISQPDELIAQRLEQLFDPFQSTGLVPLEEDWLGLAGRAQTGLMHTPFTPDLSSGALLLEDDHSIHWALLRARTQANAFDMKSAPMIAAEIARVRAEVENAGGRLLAASGVLYAASGQMQARKEMLYIGGTAIGGIIGIFFLAFRRIRTLLALLPVVVAVLAGSSACIAVFGQMNALTLVLGASLIGVAVDGPLHWLSKCWSTDKWQSWAALRRILPGLSLSLISNLIGYAALAFTPFPALTQIAVFSAVGLIGAYVCTVGLLPAGFTRLHLTPPRLWRNACILLLNIRVRLLKRTGIAPLVAVLGVFIAGGLWQVHSQNDPRQWLTHEPALQAQAQQIAALTGEQPTSQFFLVRAKDQAQLLERLAALGQQLDDRYHYRSLHQLVPATSQQAQLQAALRRLPEYWQPLLAAGIPESALQTELDQLLTAPAPTIEQMLANPLTEAWQGLWLGENEHGVAGLVSLHGTIEYTALHAIAEALPGVQLVDRLGELNNVFASTQTRAAQLKLIACLAIVWLLVWPFGVKGALYVVALPLLAALTALACLGWLGQPLTLFSLFGLLLVTAIGVDYAILMRENIGGPAVSLLGTLLSALTSWLSFGLLMISQTPVIANFGLTVSLGLLFCFLLAPWASPSLRAVHPSENN